VTGSSQLTIFLRLYAKQSRRHGQTPVYVPAALEYCNHIFLRVEKPGALTAPYCGPFQVMDRDTKTVTISREGRAEKIAMDQVKPAYILKEPEPQCRLEDEKPQQPQRTQPTRKVRFNLK